MASDIKGLGSPNLPDQAALRGTSTSKESSTTTSERASTPPPAAAPVAKAATDSVNLSAQAQALKTLEEKLQKQPDVNEKRVAEIKAALASGNYSVDDLVVAEKLLGFDELFK
ncbi:MAG TPA: flagellar biosynthesis anti-sigma factor FlgM [Spongiibacteraceae bacterium]|nr:flagellar biosynthesis anti-sigma factor FlgM [Spongiibacteraceae bacterium]